MSLSAAPIIAFVPTTQRDAARAYYTDTLGLTLRGEDQFALVFECPGGTMLRVVSVQALTPQQFTILGWQVPDIAAAVQSLTARGVQFERFGFFEQDDLGIWTAPDGARVAWFKDPDGNTLSLTQF